MGTERSRLSAPAFYALSGGGWRDLVTLLHPPYTAWHLSYVALGAVAATTLNGGRPPPTPPPLLPALRVSPPPPPQLRRPPPPTPPRGGGPIRPSRLPP